MVTNHPTLDHLCSEAGTCTKCPLHTTRTNSVFGVGPQEALIMFVGEAPGAEEVEAASK